MENGFYYDVDLGSTIHRCRHSCGGEEDDGVGQGQKPFIRKEMSKADAVKYFEEKGDEYKLDLLEGLEDGTITFYTQGDFTDLCRGPHIPTRDM